MQGAVRRHDLAAKEVDRPIVVTRDPTAGLSHDERPRGDVPRMELLFPEAVEPPGGDVTEVERGGAETPDGTRPTEEPAEDVHLVRLAFPDRVRKARAQQRIPEDSRARNPQRPAIDAGAAPALRGEEVFAERVVPDDRLQPAL